MKTKKEIKEEKKEERKSDGYRLTPNEPAETDLSMPVGDQAILEVEE